VNKHELIDHVSAQADISKAAAGRAIDATLEAMKNALQNGDSVTLIGFGTFEVRERAARSGRDPRTGDPIDIPATRNPSFKAGKALRDAVRG
jgi:DNA-binding protein HU-beta